jgi:hypothetical protein
MPTTFYQTRNMALDTSDLVNQLSPVVLLTGLELMLTLLLPALHFGFGFSRTT